MLPKENPQAPPSWPEGLPRYEDIRTKEKAAKGIWTSMGDLVRDIGTANQMAKDKFDGDTALMHVARGAITTGVGVGFEKAMNYVWDSVWHGDIPFYDKNKFGPDMAKAMNAYARKGNMQARLVHFAKAGTEDLSKALFYNFMAFRGQPVLPKVTADHLVSSLGLDALEAFTLPGIPAQVRDSANASDLAINTAAIKKSQREQSDLMRARETVKVREYQMPVDAQVPDTLANEIKKKTFRETTKVQYEFADEIEELRGKVADLKHERGQLPARTRRLEYDPDAHSVERVLQTVSGASNAITHLGVEWMANGAVTLFKNIRAVRKARSEKGGLPGKKVFMPEEDRYKKDDRWKKDDRRGGQKPWEQRSWQDRKPQQEKRPQDDRDKVYYGKSKWDQKKLEEYELKGS